VILAERRSDTACLRDARWLKGREANEVFRCVSWDWWLVKDGTERHEACVAARRRWGGMCHCQHDQHESDIKSPQTSAMPLSTLYENRPRDHQWSKSEPGMHTPRMHSPVSRPLRSGGGSSHLARPPRHRATPMARPLEAPADVLSGTPHATDGAQVEKQKRKPKKKGWKGYATVY
jgi:hypothetical protein